MKKLFITGVVAALAFSTAAMAEVQISGNVTTLAGYQHDDKDAVAGKGGLTQTDLGYTASANGDHYGVQVPQAELDVENEFGENITARFDVDFADLNKDSTGGQSVGLEQAYVTTNLSFADGEFLVGKFNAPLALESVDRNENAFSTYTLSYQTLAPKNVIGAKAYFELNDTWSLDLGVINTLNESFAGVTTSAIPTGFARLGTAWGDEGNQSYINLAAAVGPETTTNGDMDYYVSAWGNWALGDVWDLGWETIYRQTTADAAVDQKAASFQAVLGYQASDSWTIQGRAATLWDINPASGGASTTAGTWTGSESLTYSGSLAGTYTITDDASFTLEGRYDYVDASAGASADYMTAVGQFAYTF